MSASAERPFAWGLGLATTLGTLFLGLPVVSLVFHDSPAVLWSALHSPVVGQAALLSLTTSGLALALSLLLGVPIAFLLARTRFRGRDLLQAILTLPIVLPPVVGGLGLLLLLGRAGWLGSRLQLLGISLPFTTAAVVLAETFVAAPFLIVTVQSGFENLPSLYEEVAHSLGASTPFTFFRIQLPLIAPALAAGAALTWARALGEFGATITFAGNLPGTTQTLPLAVYQAAQSDLDGAVALAVILLAISLGLLVALRARPGAALRAAR
jgi:molybdate transport system permease protein